MLEELKKCLKSELKDRGIFDIVVYGSLVKNKENPNDIDILVIFNEGNLKERLNKIQSIKSKIKTKEKIDIKGILWQELFQDEFFARSGIFLEGISIFTGKPFAERIDFNGFAIFVYNLTNKSHADKVKFNYVLSGRKSEGLIKGLEGKHPAPGVIEIPIKNSLEFENVLKKNNISYFKKEVLIKR